HTRFSRDWSSDVCSSDLLSWMITPWFYRGLNTSCKTLKGYGLLVSLLMRLRCGVTCGSRPWTWYCSISTCPTVMVLTNVLRSKEIGRASCRGRRRDGAGG